MASLPSLSPQRVLLRRSFALLVALSDSDLDYIAWTNDQSQSLSDQRFSRFDRRNSSFSSVWIRFSIRCSICSICDSHFINWLRLPSICLALNRIRAWVVTLTTLHQAFYIFSALVISLSVIADMAGIGGHQSADRWLALAIVKNYRLRQRDTHMASLLLVEAFLLG